MGSSGALVEALVGLAEKQKHRTKVEKKQSGEELGVEKKTE